MMLFEAPYRQILIGVSAALAVAFLSKLGRRAPERLDGWKRLEPSPMHWTALVGSGGAVLLFAYVQLFVGSSLPDAESQMKWLTGLIIAFSICVLISAWTVIRLRRQAFEWRGNLLAWRERSGASRTQEVDDLAVVNRTAMGWIVLSFTNGEIVRLDEHARGMDELLDQIADQRSDLAETLD